MSDAFWQDGDAWRQVAATSDLHALADDLKREVDQLLRTRDAAAERVAQRLIALGGYAAGRGWQIAGNIALLARGDFQQADHAFLQAHQLFTQLDQPVEAARSDIGRFAALANLGDYTKAVAVGQRASAIFTAHNATHDRARLALNMAWLHDRQGDDTAALAMLDDAAQHFQDDPQRLAGIELNRAMVLRNFGRFSAALAASERAFQLFEQLDLTIEALRSRYSAATTHLVQGDMRHALQLLNTTRVQLEDARREWDSVYFALATLRCQLALGQFTSVLEQCDALELRVRNHQGRKELGKLLLIKGRAQIGVQDLAGAMTTIEAAAAVFSAENNPVAAAEATLQFAAILLTMGKRAAAFEQFSDCITQFGDLPALQTNAYLGAASAAADTTQMADALTHAFALIDKHELPTQRQQAWHLHGKLAQQRGDLTLAAASFERAIATLDQLRSQLLLDWRGRFLADKDDLFADAVQLYLQQGDIAQAWRIVQQAKSRSLIDLLGYRLDVRIEAISADDIPLITQFTTQQAERNRLLRRAEADPATAHEWLPQIEQLEKELLGVRERLLLRDSRYGQATLASPATLAEIQAQLPTDTALLDYFFAHGQLHLFLITSSQIIHERLQASADQIAMLLDFWQLNLQAIPHDPAFAPATIPHAQQLLAQLDTLLLAPVRDQLPTHLLIVPHKSLHYLPFHALHNGATYLIQQHTVSYLPTASVLTFTHHAAPSDSAFVIGNSCDGRLPQAVAEAQTIARLLQTTPLLDAEATLQAVRATAASIWHIATHGAFRADNPLFSGLNMADGQLTTLDIFNLKLNAALVTLSACETGQQEIGGGDELLGLAQAFLSAGAQSLLLTHWPVADAAMPHLMGIFYERFLAGATKAAALRAAQTAMIETAAFAHPYFWAGCFLIGK